MRTEKNSLHPLLQAAMVCTVLMLAGPAKAQNTPRIHPLSTPLVQPGIVTAVRQFNAYPYALGADKDTWGNIYCEGRSGQIPIKQTAIFRVETASHFYDLSKVCGMGGDFRWPRTYVGGGNNDYDTWNHWEQLSVGDRVKLVFEMTTVRLSVPTCQRLGLITSSEAVKIDFAPLNGEGHKIYQSQCVYQVPIMHVRIKWFTTEVAGVGAHSTDTNIQTWDFRVVGSGSKSLVKTAPIGSGYSASLPPPWSS
ncbi:MAG: hypothetical protein ACRD1J_04700 [Terriglobia bacterium]